jgi:integrase
MHVAQHGTLYDEPDDCMTLAQFVEEHWKDYATTHLKPSTCYTWGICIAHHLVPEFGAMRLDAITLPEIQRYAARVKAGDVNPNNKINVLRGVLCAACKLGKLADLPDMPELPRVKNKLPDCPDAQEVDAIVAVATGWLRTAVALAAYAGLRSGEIRALQVGDVDWVRNRIVVRRGMSHNTLTTTKGGNERAIPIAPQLLPYLRDACQGKKATDWVVVHDRGIEIGESMIWHRLDRLLAGHGMVHRKVHSLRHAFCSQLLERGATVEQVRMVAGHSSVATTGMYLHTSNDSIQQFMGAYREQQLRATLN